MIPIPDVPLNWMANSAVKSPIVIGMTVLPKARRDLQPFHSREHADSGRDDAVAEQQSSPQHQEPQQQRRAALVGFSEKAVEREDAALAVVLRAQDEDGVFDGHDQRDGPDHQRYAAEHLGRRLRAAGTAEE
jgi:hypothetical protein